MKLSDIHYQRYNIDSLKTQYHQFIENFSKDDATFQSQKEIIVEWNEARKEFDTMATFAMIQASLDVTDEFWESEQEYYDEAFPIYGNLERELYEVLIESPFRSELEKKFGAQLFVLAEQDVKTISDEVTGLVAQENKLTNKYSKIISTAQIEFDGKTLNLPGLQPYYLSEDRSVRKAAHAARDTFLLEKKEELLLIFDDLVQVRTTIANKLGFSSFVELGYERMHRIGYDRTAVESFREAVQKHLVPIISKLRESQRKRLELETLFHHDEKRLFKDSAPVPLGVPDWIVSQGTAMYKEMSAETHEFFEYMQENKLMDLVNNKNKRPGGYCTHIAEDGSPYIFSNFNGTDDDIQVLTHEVGHAFQVYMSRKHELLEYKFPTTEACEIHSMSMEFFTYPWMKNFFEGNADQFKYKHLVESLDIIPYICLIDEFQHEMYTQTSLKGDERLETFRHLEEMYMPSRNYEGDEFMNKGAYWLRQSHVFRTPFYYIDYALAQICAFQFLKKMSEDWGSAWADYLNLCKQGGTKPFLQLVEEAGLRNPFKEETVKEVAEWIEGYLEEEFEY